jgi:hypothetical protein
VDNQNINWQEYILLIKSLDVKDSMTLELKDLISQNECQLS